MVTTIGSWFQLRNRSMNSSGTSYICHLITSRLNSPILTQLTSCWWRSRWMWQPTSRIMRSAARQKCHLFSSLQWWPILHDLLWSCDAAYTEYSLNNLSTVFVQCRYMQAYLFWCWNDGRTAQMYMSTDFLFVMTLTGVPEINSRLMIYHILLDLLMISADV